MSDEWDGFCAVCASRDYCGDLRIHELDERRRAEHGELQRVRLCTPCFAFVAESLGAGVRRTEGSAGELHLPERVRSASPGDGCEVCHRAELWDGVAVLLEVADDAASPAPLSRLHDVARAHRLCPGCLGWFRDVLDQESASRWGNRRREGEPRGGAPVDVNYRATAHGLAPKDHELVAETVTNLGYTFADGGEGDPARDEHVYFVAAGPGRYAAAFTDALPVTERVRVIVVASADHLADAGEALRLGAADLLAAPLSRQQITGAFDRLADPFAVSGRDETTGLSTYWMRPRFGLTCHLVEVTPPAGERSLDVFLVLRRFLRGYDRIGIASDGSLPALVYCSDERLDGVVRRMRILLGSNYGVAVLGRADGDALPPADDPAAHRRPVLAAAFFGRSISRRAG